MSTNYYIKGYDGTGIIDVEVRQSVIDFNSEDPNWHIGKRYGRSGGRIGFVWAMKDREELLYLIAARKLSICFKCIVDEYGREFTFNEFYKEIKDALYDLNSVGKYFC